MWYILMSELSWSKIASLSPQLIEWFEEYAEEFFQTNTELGESLDVAEVLVAELRQFEESTQVSPFHDLNIFHVL